jgi:hypothetical protein
MNIKMSYDEKKEYKKKLNVKKRMIKNINSIKWN